MPITDDKKVDIWIEHSNQLWRAIYATPVIAATILVGWYAIIGDGYSVAPKVLLGAGAAIMIIQFFIVRRMIQYADAFKRTVGEHLPEIEKPLLGFSGSNAASMIPLFVFALFVVLIIVDFDAPKSAPDAGNPTAREAVESDAKIEK